MSFTQPGYPQGPSSLGALSDDEQPDDDAAKAPVTRKIVNRQMLFAVLFAVLVAVVGAALLFGGRSATWVVVASEPIAAAGKITEANITAVRADPDTLVPGAFTGDSQAAALDAAATAVAGGSRANQPILVNEQISAQMLGAGKVLAEDLAPNERLMSITASVSRAVAGQITPGDRVDVLGTVNGTTGILARDVLVVTTLVAEEKLTTTDAGGDDPAALVQSAAVPGIYMVRVTNDTALRLAAVQETGTLTLLWNPAGSSETPAGALTGLDAITSAG